MAGTAGIGVQLREIVSKNSATSEIQIGDLVPQGPAKLGGILHVGDVITKVAGKSVRGLDTVEVYRLLVGPPKSRVRVQVRRGTATFDSTLIREEVKKGEKTELAKKDSSKKNTMEGKQLTAMEQARKVAGGTGGRGVYKYSRRKDLGKATEEEAARIRGKNERIMDEAQAIADKEYEEEKAQYEADLKRRNKEGMSQFWNLLWYGDETGPPPPPPPKEKKAGWHRKTAKDIKKSYKAKKNEVIAYFSGIYIEHKVNKFSKQIFGQEEKNGFLGIGRKKKQPGLCAPCSCSRK